MSRTKVGQPLATSWSFGLEAARLVMLGTLVAVSLLALWVVIRALDLDEPLRDGQLSSTDVERLDVALRWATRALAASFPAQALWIWTSAVATRRTDTTDADPRPAATAAIVAAAASAAAMLLESTPVLHALSLLAGAACALVAVRTVGSVNNWLGRTRTIAWMWAGCIVTLVATTLAWGGYRPTTATTSVNWLALIGLVIAQIAALQAVLTGGLALEVEDGVRAGGTAHDEDLEA